MAKKLILLILILPIILMVVLFFATKTVSNLIDIPVSKIEIIGENRHIYIDMDKEETYSLEYVVYPTNAANSAVSFSCEEVEGAKGLATFDFLPDGRSFRVVPKSAGSAKVTLTTIDGGFRDSVIIHVDSTRLQSIECSVPESTLTVGDKTSINTTYFPENPSNTLVKYVSDNPKVASVNQKGEITALTRGTAVITVISEYNESIRDTVKITVRNQDAMDLGKTEINTFGTSGSIPISIASDDAISASNITYKFCYSDGSAVPTGIINANVNVSGADVSLDYTFTDTSFVGDIIAKITFSHGETVITKECSISRVKEISLSFDEGISGIDVGQTKFVNFTLTPDDVDVIYDVKTSNNNVTARMANGRLIVTATRAGVTKITLTVTTLDEPIQTKTAEYELVIKPKTFFTKESAKDYGIEGILTLGKHEYSYENGLVSLVDTFGTVNALSLGYTVPENSDKTSTAGALFKENVKWISSAPNSVTINQDGKIHVIDESFSDIVEFYAEFSYGGISMTTDKIKIRCVGSGVNVYSYKDLYYATVNEEIVILHNDIKDDFGYIDGEIMYTEMMTTYDDTYYSNVGRKNEAKVKILISFKNDIYGNGHVINADKVTYQLIEDQNGNKTQSPDALFKGPLNFVMATHMNNETGLLSTISVKAQDNICFALYDGVNVNNVELRGCDLRPDVNGKYDLVDLTYIGTTVEVLGDDVTIEYSRLTNGRTVLRAFGDATDSTKKINVSITNSVLSGAREFIMRIGSNRFEDAKKGDISPHLDGDDATKKSYNTKKIYNSLSDEEKESYDNSFINTFVTVKNSIFKDTGLFAVGMDSHFAGAALADGSKVSEQFKQLEGLLDGWLNLAKTSYGAKLTFEGEVELYNWKRLDDVDSSSLIEITGNYAIFNDMSFDVKSLIENISKKAEYSNIVTSYNGHKMVHAGIAFFGGGKNYSVFEAKNNSMLYNYSMSFSDINKHEMVFAAGSEPFYFFLYDKTSSFSPKVQEEKLKTNAAYDCIYKK